MAEVEAAVGVAKGRVKVEVKEAARGKVKVAVKGRAAVKAAVKGHQVQDAVGHSAQGVAARVVVAEGEDEISIRLFFLIIC